jgi:hypothetical protein
MVGMKSKCCFKVMFKRGAKSDWEWGAAIGYDIGDINVIVDYNNEMVPFPLWDFKSFEYEGLMWINLPEQFVGTGKYARK